MPTEMTMRDTFAAAALTGLIASREWPIDSEEAAHYCYRVADAMLRERERTNHDAAPAARASEATASPERVRVRGDAGTGESYSASACDGADVLSTHDSGGPINRAANWGQPPARRGESERRDVTHPDTKGRAAGGPAHNTQEPVAWGVSDLRDGLLCTSIYRSDASEMQSEFAFETKIVPLYRASDFAPPPPDFAPPPPDFAEPVAWAVILADGDRIYDVYAIEEDAKAIDGVVTGNHGVVPLYRHPQPTLTESEREAVERSAAAWEADARMGLSDGGVAATLRGLLERMK